MAEVAKIMHTDKEYVYKILEKYLRIEDRKLLEANVEINALEPRLALKLEGIQSTLDEIAPTEPRAKTIKPQGSIRAISMKWSGQVSSSSCGGRKSRGRV